MSFFKSRISDVHAFRIRDRLSERGRRRVVVIPRLSIRDRKGITFARFLPGAAVLIIASLFFLHSEISQICTRNFSARTLVRRRIQDRVRRTRRRRGLETSLVLISKTYLLESLLSFREVRVKRGPDKIPRIILRFRRSPRPVCRGGFSLIGGSFSSFLRGKCALCVLTSSTGRTRQLTTVFRSRTSKVMFAPMSGALRNNFSSRSLGVYYFASRRVFSQFRGCGLQDSGTHDKGITLSLGRLRRFGVKSCMIRMSRNINGFNNLIRLPINSAIQRVVGVVCRGSSLIFIPVRSLRGIDGCQNGSNRPPHVGHLKAKT